MSDELDVLTLVAVRLDAIGIPYMVSGSMAMNYYAQPRMTRDIDIVVELSPVSAERLVDAFSPDFYIDRDATADAVVRRGMFNAIHTQLVVKVDFIVRKDTAFRHEEFARRRQIVVDGTTLWLVSPEDLILSKLDWAKDSESELQLGDVRNVIRSLPDLDWTYIERWAPVLGVAPLLARVRG